jgi:hypothetical protein
VCPEQQFVPRWWVGFEQTDCCFQAQCWSTYGDGPPSVPADVTLDGWIGPFEACPSEAEIVPRLPRVKLCDQGQPPPPSPPAPPSPPVPPPEPVPPIIPPPNPDGTVPPPKPPKPGKPVRAVDWCEPSLCNAVVDYVVGTNEDISQWIPSSTWVSQLTSVPGVEEVEDAIENAAPTGFKNLASWIGFILLAPIVAALDVIRYVVPCELSRYLPLAGRLWTLSVVQKWTGADLGDVVYRQKSLQNALCPYVMPTTADANAAYLMDGIGRAEWLCWVRLNGQCEGPQQKLVHAARTKPDQNEATALYRRGVLDEETWGKAMRQAGVLEPEDARRFYELSTFIPGPSDLIRFMTRDSFDDAVVERFQYDQDFQKKYTAKAEEWGFAQGIDTDTAKYYWRAHWDLPSAGQAYEMLHRLRPDKDGVTNPVTRDDVRQLLQVNDMAPFWQERLIDISYAVPRLVDTRNGYFKGAVSRNQLLSILQDRGYDLPTAKWVRGLFDKQKLDWASGRYWAKLRRQCLITDAEAQEYADIDGVDYDTFREVMSLMGKLREADLRKTCAAGVKGQYTTGGLLPADAINALMQLGLEGGCATQMVQLWTCQLKAKGKLPAIAQMCSWLQHGILSPAEMSARIVNMGYSPADAQRFVANCILSIKRREQQDQQKKDKDKAREDAAKKRAAEKEANQKQRGEARKRRDTKAEQKAAERRRLKLEKSAEVVSAVCGIRIEEAQDALLLRIGKVNLLYGFSLDGSYDWVSEIAKESAADDPTRCLDTIDYRISLLPRYPWDDEEITGYDNPEPAPPAGAVPPGG